MPSISGSGSYVNVIGTLTKASEVQSLILGATDEVQFIQPIETPNSGTWSITFDPDGTGPIAPQTTGNLQYNASAATVKTALEAILGAGNVNVSGTFISTAGLTVSFVNGMGQAKYALMTINNANLKNAGLTVAVNVTETAAGGAIPASGQYTLTFDPDGTGPIAPQTTSACNYNDTAATIQAKLQALSTIGTNGVTVTSGSMATSGAFVLSFGGLLLGRDLDDAAITYKTSDMYDSATITTLTQGGSLAYNTSQTISLGTPRPHCRHGRRDEHLERHLRRREQRDAELERHGRRSPGRHAVDDFDRQRQRPGHRPLRPGLRDHLRGQHCGPRPWAP